jgi:hypothetical protein
MALITKPDMEFIWASGGAIIEPSDVKKQTGWTPEVPPHQWENWVQNRQDQYIAHVNQRGIPAWDGNTEYEAGGLSYTQGSDGKIYKSVTASGPSTTTQNPTTDVSDTYWTVAFADVGAFLTQTAGDARYAQKNNNLSDLNNLATARTNLGVQNAVEAGIQGAFSNLKLSSTGLSSTVTITADNVCVKNSSNFQVVLNNVNIPTLSLSSSGSNGLDTGVSASNTWYSVWVIWNGTTTAGLLSLSATSPTLPSGYTHKARVGWIRTDATANKFPLSFVQNGNKVQYKIAPGSNLLARPVAASGVVGAWSATTPTYAAVSVVNFVPPTAVKVALTLAGKYANGTTSNANIAPNASYSGVSSSNPPVASLSAAGGTSAAQDAVYCEMTLESTNVYACIQSTGGAIIISGWEDSL